jgi:Leucine-rich repeat (LRR) protein
VKRIDDLNDLDILVLNTPELKYSTNVRFPKNISHMEIVFDKNLAFTEFKDLPLLEILSLTYSPHVNFPVLQGLPNLQKLEINKSKLSSLAGLQQIPQVKEVTLQEGNITSLAPLKDMNNMTQLESLHLRRNNINEFVDIGDKPNLKYIDLSFNPLEKVDVDALAKYPYMYLDYYDTGVASLDNAELHKKMDSIHRNGHP